MKKFKIRLRFTHTPGNYMNPLNVFLNDNLATSIGRCDVSTENGEIVGIFSLDEEISDKMYVYYRWDKFDQMYHAIQLRDKPLNEQAMTIAELRRE